jgi:sec-independent protein translocase protein TatB
VLDINGWEFVMLLVIGVIVLGPERLPEYAAKLGRLVRQLKVMARDAQAQLKEQMGPEFEDVDWRQYDPRQYDPRRIVREALMDDGSSDEPDKPQSGPMASPSQPMYDAQKPTPWDADAT